MRPKTRISATKAPKIAIRKAMFTTMRPIKIVAKMIRIVLIVFIVFMIALYCSKQLSHVFVLFDKYFVGVHRCLIEPIEDCNNDAHDASEGHDCGADA